MKHGFQVFADSHARSSRIKTQARGEKKQLPEEKNLKKMSVHFFYATHGDDLYIIFLTADTFLIVLRNDDLAEPQLFRFGYSLLNTIHRANLTTETNLSGKAHFVRDGHIFK
jgi:hypothetical protein